MGEEIRINKAGFCQGRRQALQRHGTGVSQDAFPLPSPPLTSGGFLESRYPLLSTSAPPQKTPIISWRHMTFKPTTLSSVPEKPQGCTGLYHLWSYICTLVQIPGRWGRWNSVARYDHEAAHSHTQNLQPAHSHRGSRNTKGKQKSCRRLAQFSAREYGQQRKPLGTRITT